MIHFTKTQNILNRRIFADYLLKSDSSFVHSAHRRVDCCCSFCCNYTIGWFLARCRFAKMKLKESMPVSLSYQYGAPMPINLDKSSSYLGLWTKTIHMSLDFPVSVISSHWLRPSPLYTRPKRLITWLVDRASLCELLFKIFYEPLNKMSTKKIQIKFQNRKENSWTFLTKPNGGKGVLGY